MSEQIERRDFLGRSWKVGALVIGGAGIWTSWDVLQPLPSSGLGGVIKTVPQEEVDAEQALYVRSAQTYLTEIDGEVVALWHRCPHLGCRVSWCDSAGEFECACHGSRFSRAGDVRSGPSPRGMDRFAVTVTDGVVEVDTGDITDGSPPGTESVDEPKRGPSCAEVE